MKDMCTQNEKILNMPLAPTFILKKELGLT